MEKHYNLAFLKDYFDDDMESILPILKLYIEETPKEISKIEDALLQKEIAIAKAATHKIKTNVAMLGVRDTTTFVNDMHLLQPSGEVTTGLMKQFAQFKDIVTSALQQIQQDFFSNKKAEPL